MIYLTTAHNDKDLPKHFQNMSVPCPIPFGDFIFKGVWTNWEPIMISGERKHLPDLLKCINDNRHLEQIRGARAAGFTQVFLVVEDQFREAADGDVELYRKRRWERQGFDYGRLESYPLQLEYYAGIRVFFTKDARETAHKVIAIYRMFQQPPEEHSSLNGFHQVAAPVGLDGKPSLMRRTFKEQHGIGWIQSARAEEYFKSKGYSIVQALSSGDEWQNIPAPPTSEGKKGKGVGPEIARMIYEDNNG